MAMTLYVGSGVAEHKVGIECGISMRQGVLDGSCLGSFIVLYRGETKVISCDHLNHTVFYSPIGLTLGPCSSLLLDHAECSKTNPSSPCFSPSRFGPLVVMLVVMALLVLILSIITVFQCRMKAEKLTWEEIKFEHGRVVVYGNEDARSYSLLKFLFAFCLCCSTSSAYCVDPYSSHTSANVSYYNYRLRVGQSACFSDGQILHLKNEESYSLDHQYDTLAWDHYVWSHNGCGNGDMCGNMRDCGRLGNAGIIAQQEMKIYKKVCKTYSVAIFACVSYWACWLATMEVSYRGKDLFSVYTVGESENEDLYEKVGLNNCEVGMNSQRPMFLNGKLLVVNRRDHTSWLCPTGSEKSFPTPGKLGDLQVLANKTTFNFDAFNCELESSSSSGGCKVVGSFMSHISDWCISLPMLVDGGVLSHNDGELIMENSGFDDFTLRFEGADVPVLSDHNCYDKAVKIVGLRGDKGMFMYIFSARSTNNSSWVVHSDCNPEPIEVLL